MPRRNSVASDAPAVLESSAERGQQLRVSRGPKAVVLMLQEFIGQKVVVDLRCPFVCLGTLHALDELHLELRNADLHDLRDTQTTRENYVVASASTGIKRNRKRLLVVRAEVVAISRLEDVVDD